MAYVFAKLSDDWSALSDAEKKEMFESTNYETASVADLETLEKFKVLAYSESDDAQEVSLTAVPHDRLIKSRGFFLLDHIAGVERAELSATMNGAGLCKLLVTIDGRNYQTYDFSAEQWRRIEHTDLAAVKADGIEASRLATIGRGAWDKLLKGKAGVGFAYLLSKEAAADACDIDRLQLIVEKKGTWGK